MTTLASDIRRTHKPVFWPIFVVVQGIFLLVALLAPVFRAHAVNAHTAAYCSSFASQYNLNYWPQGSAGWWNAYNHLYPQCITRMGTVTPTAFLVSALAVVVAWLVVDVFLGIGYSMFKLSRSRGES
jgi:hypothetical protein